MKFLLITFGKAWRVFRRDGLSGVVRGIFATVRPIRAGDILVVTGGIGDSARYRAAHIVEELRERGFRASFVVQNNLWLPFVAERFSAFIFHRTFFSSAIARLIERIKENEGEIIFDADDLTFDPELFRSTGAYAQMDTAERALYEQGLGSEILNDPYVKTATAPTSFLADRFALLGKRTFVVSNKLSKRDVACAKIARSEEQKKSSLMTLAYFSGSASHNRDFATIKSVLLAVLEKYENVQLSIYGPLVLDPAFDVFGARVRRIPYAPRRRHWRNVARADINLAPLEIGDPFCEAKSELKFFEAGACGVPTVAASTRTFREAIDDGVDGFVASTPDEWMSKLEQLIVDPTFRTNMGEQARKKTLEVYTTTSVGNASYDQYLTEIIAKKKRNLHT